MLVSHRARFVFVHVHKTAGMSMERALKQNFPDLERWHGRHGHAGDGFAEWGADRWREYYSFGFVRNPWERLVSWYKMIDEHRRDLPIHKRWRRAPFKFELWNQVARKGRTFDDFIENCTDVVFDRDCQKSFAYNQLDYLSDRNGELIVTKVGRYEDLANDVAEVFGRLNICTSLPHSNASRPGHYSHWYNDRTRQIVAERYARDIAAFGYDFEQPNS